MPGTSTTAPEMGTGQFLLTIHDPYTDRYTDHIDLLIVLPPDTPSATAAPASVIHTDITGAAAGIPSTSVEPGMTGATSGGNPSEVVQNHQRG